MTKIGYFSTRRLPDFKEHIIRASILLVLLCVATSCATYNQGRTTQRDTILLAADAGSAYDYNEKKFVSSVNGSLFAGISDNFNLGLSTGYKSNKDTKVSIFGLYNFSKTSSGVVLGLAGEYTHFAESKAYGIPFLTNSSTYEGTFFLIPSLVLGVDQDSWHTFYGISLADAFVGTKYNFGLWSLGVMGSLSSGLGFVLGTEGRVDMVR